MELSTTLALSVLKTLKITERKRLILRNVN